MNPETVRALDDVSYASAHDSKFIESTRDKVHSHQIAPSVAWMAAEFRRHFTTATLDA